jgi:hypothetical protein
VVDLTRYTKIEALNGQQRQGNREMVTLPNGVEIPEQDLPIWQAYGFHCVIHPALYAICLHEEPPKSLNPKWREMPETRYPVCDSCHQLLHSLPRRDAGFLLEKHRKRNYPMAEEVLLEQRKSAG